MNTHKTIKLIDSHCHLQSLDLTDFENDLDVVLSRAHESGVHKLLCVCIELEDTPKLKQMADQYSNLYISVGVHPNNEMNQKITADELIVQSKHPACIAIGETGLDYYRIKDKEEITRQQQQFCEHIRASIVTSKPLIIHTRQAPEDTLRLMKEENASEVGGVLHCFTESWDMAKQALDLGFYISFSGIVTFKNAASLREVVKQVPLDRILIETDSPYLAPVPFRGKQNHPSLVTHVAEQVAELKGTTIEKIAEQTTDNFYQCFKVIQQ